MHDRAHRPDLLERVPPTALVLASMASIQFGAAFAKGLFGLLGGSGTVTLRVLFAALMLLIFTRPRLRGLPPRSLALLAAFGLSLGLMNLAFYLSLERLPLGVAVTLEFVGPLGVALFGTRRRRDLMWVGLAALGVLLLNPLSSGLDPVGVLLALFAGLMWAAYIVLGSRIGQVIPGGGSIALVMLVAALVVLPFGAEQALPALTRPELLLGGLVVALLSSALPYTLELEALRRMPRQTFGILMSLEPAVAATAGWLILGESLGWMQLAAIACVVAASLGTTRSK
ncbi:inner membrane transporter RhtA [Deinobacterium chartae]|uniref:Inner membrane transporter RhtA n=1 Tax=Deinobacterium chartae TaxID=521158 RepID=A0A841HXX4_9DEIO|nr:EamA family transporter [Deinobacterium chartae]MBB6097050.1 inner membrane transporter RhtA [Deinobacterium chartae]